MKQKHIFIQVCLLLALATQVSHAAFIFGLKAHTTGSDMVDSASPWLSAISVEMLVFGFTLYGKKWVALFFAACSITLNALYYYSIQMTAYDYLVLIISSIIFPVAIWFCSELFDADMKAAALLKSQLQAKAERKAALLEKKARPASKPARPNRKAPKQQEEVPVKMEAV